MFCNIKIFTNKAGYAKIILQFQIHYMRSKKVKFEVKGNQFYKDDKAVKIISGAVHYFGNMPDAWAMMSIM